MFDGENPAGEWAGEWAGESGLAGIVGIVGGAQTWRYGCEPARACVFGTGTRDIGLF